MDTNTCRQLFIRRVDDQVTVLIVYVDDIVITGNDEHEITKLKAQLVKEFEIKDLGPLRYSLRIEVAKLDRGILMYHRKYVLDLLDETLMLGYRSTDSSIEVNYRLSVGVSEVVEKRDAID